MKSLARGYCWWPKMNEHIEKFVKSCDACQRLGLCTWNPPAIAWERLHIDITGPVEGKMWFVLVDAFSKWIEVYVTNSTSAENIIGFLNESFSRFGIPKFLVSDNGPQFLSNIFKTFCSLHNIKHIKSTPYHSRTNGQAERAIRTIKEKYAKLNKNETIENKLRKCLFWYRNSENCSTGRTPAELLIGRKLKTSLDNIKPNVKSNMREAYFDMKRYHDRSSKSREFCEGDQVWIKNPLKPGFSPGIISKKTGDLSYKILNEEGSVSRKHADQLRYRESPLEIEEISNDLSKTPEKMIVTTSEDGKDQKVKEIHDKKGEDFILRRSERLKKKAEEKEGNNVPSRAESETIRLHSNE